MPSSESKKTSVIALSVFSSRLSAVCDEMGARLRQAALSPNIKDRLDYSCAVFDGRGQLCSQAAHIPVHLGSMAYAMQDLAQAVAWQEGDVLVVNDPFLGGTHLPDVTFIAPVFIDKILQGFVANRAHHVNIGADESGSMPIATSLAEEGVVIAPTLIQKQGQLHQPTLRLLCGQGNSIVALSGQASGDFLAQLSTCSLGVKRLEALIRSYGEVGYAALLASLFLYAERLALNVWQSIPNGRYQYGDIMDDDGAGQRNIAIRVSLDIRDGRVAANFAGTAAQVPGNINCPLSVAAAAVYYVFRCLLPSYTPSCAGTFRPLTLSAPVGSLVNARRPAAVAAGNVETSSRIVDVVMGALAKALPERMPASSQGTMNNLAMGAKASESQVRWDYYETLGGGGGAGPAGRGASGRQTHMTNTLNTPIESLESHYPLRVKRYALRCGSGGQGAHSGGDGVVRAFEFLAPARVSLLTERRYAGAPGLEGGLSGQTGENHLNNLLLPPKTSFDVAKGDILTIATPGGGGWRSPPQKA